MIRKFWRWLRGDLTPKNTLTLLHPLYLEVIDSVELAGLTARWCELGEDSIFAILLFRGGERKSITLPLLNPFRDNERLLRDWLLTLAQAR